MRERVKAWLSESGCAFGKAATEEGMNWLLEASHDKLAFSFLVGEPVAEPETLLVLTIARFSEYELQVKSVSAKEHRDLFYDIRFRLLSADVAFDLAEDLCKITVSQVLFQDETTRGVFWRTISELSKAILCVKWTLEERFGSLDTIDSNGAAH